MKLRNKYRKIWIALALIVLTANFISAEIIHEAGSLIGFLGGSCPDCEYDNWISHISEGIADPGYNNYGPLALDPQTNGFGQYTEIEDTPQGDSTIAQWYAIFESLLDGDTNAVDQQLTTYELDSLYQLVVLHDSTRDYYILREVLNMSYYDEQGTPGDTTDDVRGSFDAGWGVYIYSPTAAYPEVLIEIPHPADDFPSPFIGTAAFMHFDAGFLMITGAGREVLWTQQGEYNNGKSLSDPSRNDHTVFQAAHRAFVDNLPDEFVLQLHSYDSESHEGQKSLVVSAGNDDRFPNEPILDRCVFDDMISMTSYIAVPANTAGTHPDVPVNEYYQLWYEGGYEHQGIGPTIATTGNLYGYGQNRQVLYSHLNHRKYQDPENIIHIEMDEFPDLIQDPLNTYYLTGIPGGVTFANFANAIEYYRHAFEALFDAFPQVPMSELVVGSPSPLDFSPTLVFDSDTLWAHFQNISMNLELEILDVYTDEQVFSILTSPTGITLFPGMQCSVQVVFHPRYAAGFSRVLTLSTDIGCSHLELRGTGLGGIAELEPPEYNFGLVSIYEVQLGTVFLHNGGNYPMNMVTVTQAPPHFYFINFPDSTIPPDGRVPLELLFLPLEIGNFQDTMYVITNTYDTDTLKLYVSGQGGIVNEVFFDDFSQDLGWTGFGIHTEWTRGEATGGPGDDQYGGPDPALDHTPGMDNRLLGTDLTFDDGDYEPYISATEWITSPIIDCSVITLTQLKFWQWLGVERNDYDHAYIQVYDGYQWVEIWENGEEIIDESAWTQQIYDVSNVADLNPNFQVRFGIGPTDGSWQYCGWNIDDFTVFGSALIIPPNEFFFDDFAEDLGWSGYGSAGEWTRSAPMGGPGDDTHGGPDPVEDHSPTADNFVAGTDLTVLDGDYEPDLGETYWLTSPFINCASYINVQLNYWRWLGVERNDYDHAYIQIFNGTDWVTKWENGAVTIDENAWHQNFIDVSQEADGNPLFRIRFGIGPTDDGWQYCGWNIDDVSLRGIGSAITAISDLTISKDYNPINGSVYLHWSPISGAVTYKVHRGDSLNFEVGPQTLIYEVAHPDTSYEDSDIINQTDGAFYRVVVCDE